MLFKFARDFRGSTGARAIQQALDTLIGKAMHPFAQGRIGKLERVRDVLKALSFDDFTDGLGATEDAHLFGLLEHRLSRGQSRIGKLALKRPHRGPLLYKLLRKLCKTISYAMRLYGDPRIGATSFRLKFSRSCLKSDEIWRLGWHAQVGGWECPPEACHPHRRAGQWHGRTATGLDY